MQGMELARAFYAACEPILWQKMPQLMHKACVGLVGEGSECFGVDDALSQDHDFGAAFCLWLPDAIVAEEQTLIEEAFAELPTSWNGVPSRLEPSKRMGRVGPMGIGRFYKGFLGCEQAPYSNAQWLAIPEYQLAAATNGSVFYDGAGAFSAIRAKLTHEVPEEVRFCKMAARLLQMAQAGQYNYPRVVARNDSVSALLCLARFTEAALSFVYLVNRCWMPFYKHARRLAENLPLLGERVVATVDTLAGAAESDAKLSAMEAFALEVTEYLNREALTRNSDPWLWGQGVELMSKVHDPFLRRQDLIHL